MRKLDLLRIIIFIVSKPTTGAHPTTARPTTLSASYALAICTCMSLLVKKDPWIQVRSAHERLAVKLFGTLDSAQTSLPTPLVQINVCARELPTRAPQLHSKGAVSVHSVLG